MQCEECGKDLTTRRVFSPTAPNRPRFCSAVCRGRGYRAEKVKVMLTKLTSAERAIQETKAMLAIQRRSKNGRPNHGL